MQWLSSNWRQETLANTKVSVREQCMYESPLAKKSMASQRSVEKYI